MDAEVTLDFNPDADLDEVIATYLKGAEAGVAPSQHELLARYPAFAADLAEFFADQERLQCLAEPVREAVTGVPPAGTMVRYFGDYELLEEIARGGMGVVYRARQVSLNRVVALKMILAGQLAAPEDVQRFRREAEAAAHLDHPHIVPIYEVGEHDGQHYFSMKLIDGGSLAGRQLPLPGWQAAQLLATVAGAVHHAHQRGILHRDLKPGNILLDAQGQPHVTDFGLAKRVEGDEPHTRTGGIVGTPGYMAPEQARSEKTLTTATDVYGLGAVLYELLTGRPPFGADTPLETLLQVREQEPQRPRVLNREVGRDLETVCLKCLEKEPPRRYGSAEALADDLERWLAGEPVRARPSTRVERLAKWARRRPAAAGLVVVSAAGLIGLLVLAGFLWRNAVIRAAAVQDLTQAYRELDNARTERQQVQAQAARDQQFAEQKRAEVVALTDTARSIRYDAEIQLAAAAWESEDIQHLVGILERLRPRKGERDLRGFEWYYLWRAWQSGRRLSLRNPPAPGERQPPFQGVVEQVMALSPDGKVVACLGLDGKIRLWDLASGQRVGTFAAPVGPIVSLAFEADGKSLTLLRVKGKPFKRVEQELQDVMAGRSKPSLKGLVSSFDLQKVSRDGSILGGGEPLDLTRLASPAQFKSLLALGIMGVSYESVVPLKTGHLLPYSFALSPDRRLLAMGGRFATRPTPFAFDPDDRGAVLLWDLATDQEVRFLETQTGESPMVEFSPDGKTLAAAGPDRTIELWDLVKVQKRALLSGHAAGVTGAVFSPNGRLLASGSADGAVKVWDADTGELRMTFLGQMGGVARLAFRPGGKELVALAGDATVRVWELGAIQGPRRVRASARDVSALAFSLDGKTLTSVDQKGTLRVSDAATGTVRDQRSLKGTSSFWDCAAFSQDGTSVALSITDMDPSVRVVDTVTGRARFVFRLKHHNICALAFSPDGKILAAADNPLGGTARLWDLTTGKELHTLTGPFDGVSRVAFSPDNHTLAIAGEDQTVKLWELSSGRQRLTIKVDAAGRGTRAFPVECVAFSPNGDRLAACGGTNIVMCDVATGKAVLAITEFSHFPVCMAFSPDGRRLATGSGPGDLGRGSGVWLWDLETGQPVLTLRGSNIAVSSLAFSPDGHRLAAAFGADIRPFRVSSAERAEIYICDASPVAADGSTP
jgi:WD40 repeat protein